VKSAYGDDAGLQYAESILNYARNCDYAMCIVDNLLDILTGNEHRKTFGPIEEQKNIRLENALLDSAFENIPDVGAFHPTDPEAQVKVDVDSLRSLSQDGIDMSFLDNLLHQVNPP
jgi:bromodomain-containing protein 7/9